MQPKIYRNASWKNRQFVYSVIKMSIIPFILLIIALVNPKHFDVIYIVLIVSLFIGFMFMVSYSTGIIIDSEGATFFRFNEKRNIKWAGVKKICCLAIKQGRSQYIIGEIPLKGINTVLFQNRTVYLLPEDIKPHSIRLTDKYVTFQYRKDIFDEVLLAIDRYNNQN